MSRQKRQPPGRLYINCIHTIKVIISNKKNIFGKCGRIQASFYSCIVSTAKEGLFKPLSSMILEGNPNGLPKETRPCGKIVYTNSLGKKERFQFHDILVESINKMGETDEYKLGDVLQIIFDDFKERGIAAEVINVAEKTF